MKTPKINLLKTNKKQTLIPDNYVEVSNLFRKKTGDKIKSVKSMIDNYAKHEDVFVQICPKIVVNDMFEKNVINLERINDEMIIAVRDLKTGKEGKIEITNPYDLNSTTDNAEFVRKFYKGVSAAVKSLRAKK